MSGAAVTCRRCRTSHRSAIAAPVGLFQLPAQAAHNDDSEHGVTEASSVASRLHCCTTVPATVPDVHGAGQQ